MESKLINLFDYIGKIISFRYNSDEDFELFKGMLNIRKWLFFIPISVLIFVILRMYYLDLFNFIMFIKETSVLSFIFGLGLIFWCLSFLRSLIITYKDFLVYSEFKNVKDLKINNWHPKDILFKRPLQLDNIQEKQISFKKIGKGYILYFLCRNNDSGFRWFGVSDMPEIEKQTTGEKIIINHGNEVFINIKQIIDWSYSLNFYNTKTGESGIEHHQDIKPAIQISGIRLRGNINKKNVTISKLIVK